MGRIIFHIDQNCYFASVEMIYHPECRDVPMAVVGDKEARHGIILAKNEHAKKYGVATAEAIWQAKTKCPDLVCLPAHYDKYDYYSKKLRQMYYEYTDRVEPFGLDECWLDMTGCVKDYEEAENIALEIRNRVKSEYNLTCSVGISFNKVFAKLGSDYKKPDATTVFDEDNWKEKIWPIPASDLLFVGRNTRSKLAKINVNTIGELASCNREYLINYLGKQGAMLWDYANGLDESPVALAGETREIKSVGNSTTTASDMTSVRAVETTMHKLSDSVAARLRKHGLVGSVIQITVRDRDLKIYEHQRVLYEPTDSSRVIYETAMELFRESYDWSKGIRSIGVRCAKVIPQGSGIQMSMFADNAMREKESRLSKVIDELNTRYGAGSIRTAKEAMKDRIEDAGISGDPFHPEDGDI